MAANSNSGFVRGAIEPTGTGPYVEAVREWIERVTPRPRVASDARLRLVR